MRCGQVWVHEGRIVTFPDGSERRAASAPRTLIVAGGCLPRGDLWPVTSNISSPNKSPETAKLKGRIYTADLDKLRAKITALTVALGSDAIGWAVEHAPLSSVTSLPNLL